jgi:hypothetical protein
MYGGFVGGRRSQLRGVPLPRFVTKRGNQPCSNAVSETNRDRLAALFRSRGRRKSCPHNMKVSSQVDFGYLKNSRHSHVPRARQSPRRLRSPRIPWRRRDGRSVSGPRLAPGPRRAHRRNSATASTAKPAASRNSVVRTSGRCTIWTRRTARRVRHAGPGRDDAGNAAEDKCTAARPGITPPLFSEDGQAHACRYRQILCDLYVADGIKQEAISSWWYAASVRERRSEAVLWVNLGKNLIRTSQIQESAPTALISSELLHAFCRKVRSEPGDVLRQKGQHYKEP